MEKVVQVPDYKYNVLLLVNQFNTVFELAWRPYFSIVLTIFMLIKPIFRARNQILRIYGWM